MAKLLYRFGIINFSRIVIRVRLLILQIYFPLPLAVSAAGAGVEGLLAACFSFI
jgi:hypothetical protein